MANEIVLPEKGKVIKKGAYKTAELGDVRIADKTTKIGDEAFWCNKTITSVKIPASVKEIGRTAFSTCKKLARVEIAEGTALKTIGYHVFEDCQSLESIVIPEGVEEIEAQAFWNCTSLKSVTLPSSVKTIAPSAFEGCPLDPIVMDGKLVCYPCPAEKLELSGVFKVIGREVFSNNDTIVEVVVPKGVEVIEEDAFSWCSGLKKVVLPASLKSIGPSAFAKCEVLCDINVPEGVVVDESSFSDCPALPKDVLAKLREGVPVDATKIAEEQYKGKTDLAEFEIPVGVTEIGHRAFLGCTALQRVTIPEGVANIGWSVFEGCTALKEIVFPSTLVDLQDVAKLCRGCTSLERVVFKGAIDGLGGGSFEDCTALKEVVFEGGVGHDSYNTHEWKYDVFAGCVSLRLTIPEGVTDIQSGAFERCTFEEIELPSTVKNLYSRAFGDCTALKTVSFPAKMWVERGAFEGCDKKLKKIKRK